MSYESLRRTVAGGAGLIRASAAGSVAFIGLNGPAFPSLLMASAVAGVPFSPLNYRLSKDGLAELLARLDRPLVVVDEAFEDAVRQPDQVMTVEAWLSAAAWRRRRRRLTWPMRTARCCCSPAARPGARRVSCSATRTWSAT